MGEIEGARKELENMKVKAEKKAPNVMKVAAGKIYTRPSEGEMEVSPPCCNKPPAVRVRGGEASIPDRALSHLHPGIKPIFQPETIKHKVTKPRTRDTPV